MPSFKIWKEFKKTISLLMVLMMLIPMFSIQSLAIGGGSTSTKRVTTYVYEEAQPLELEKKRLNITGLAEEIGSIKIISPESNVSNTKTTAYYNEKITFEAEIMDKDNKVIEGITEGVTWEYKSSASSMVSGDPIKITEDGGTSIEIIPSELDLTFRNAWNISYLQMTASYGGKESTVTVSINASKGLIIDKEIVELGKDITAILETAISSVGNKAKIILKKDGEAVAEIEEQEVIIKAYGESGKAEANFTIPEDLQTGIYTLEALPVGAPPLVLGRVDFEVTKEKTEPAELTNIIIWEPTGYILRPSIDPNNPYATFYKFFDTSEKARYYEFIVDERVDKVGIGCSINQQPADTRVTYKVNGVHKGEAITGTKGGRVNYETVELSIGKTTIEYIVNEGQVDEGIYTFVIDRKKTAMLDSLEITNLKEYPEWHSRKKYKFDKLKWNYFPDAINEEVEMIVSAQERYSVTYAVYDGINKENWWLESQGEVKGPLKVSLEKDPTKRKTVFFYVTSDEEDTLPSTYEVRIETSPFYLPLDDIKVENIEGDFAYLEEDIEKAKYGWGNVPGKSYTLKAKDNTKPVKIIPFFGDHGKISYYIGDNIENTKTTSESGQEIIIDKFNSDGKQSLTIKTIPEEGDYWHREYTYYFQLEQANSNVKKLLNISIDGANNFNFDPKLREYNIITHEKVNLVIDSEEGDRVYYSIDEGTEEEILGGEISLTMDLGQSKKLTLRVVPSEDNSTYVEGTYVLNFIRQSEDKETKDIDKLLTPILLYYFADDYNYFEWSLMSMASLGYKEKIDKDRYINGQAAGVATTTRQTDFAKAAINLMALGYSAEDLTTFSAKNKTVNLVEESVRVSKDIVDATDINATFNTNVFPILWASSNKEYRDKFNEIADNKTMANIDDLVQATINSQRADGSFPVIGDIDGIAMVLQGLAPYYNPDEIYDPVTIAVNRGLNYLSERQDKDRGTFDLGGKGDSNNISSESISMVTVALSALGIDANSDSRFLTRDGKGLIDVLEENFITDEGLFCHIIEKDGSKKSNGMASEQGFRALASYKGFLVKGGTFNIYNADDHIKEPCVVFPDDVLGQTIAYVKGLKGDDYEGESWAELQEVLNKAITISNNPDATHEEINSIVQELIATYQRLTPKRDFGGYITLTVEKFTLGQGYIKEPIKLPFSQGDNVAKLLTDFLGEGKYRHSGNINSGFYLSSVYDNDTREANIPRYILDKAGEITSRTRPEWLGEFDYTSEAGWMYTVNNELLSLGMSEYTVEDGDVIRVQFSVHSLGADLGGGFSESYIKPANKDKLTAEIAEINSNTDKDKLLSKEIVKAAYNKALEVLQDMESSQESVDKALKDLKTAIEGIEEPETPTTHTITFELSPKDAKVVVKDKEGKEVKAEKDKTYQLESGNYSYTVSATGYKTKTDSFTVKDTAKTIKVDLVKTSNDGGTGGGGGGGSKSTTTPKNTEDTQEKETPKLVEDTPKPVEVQTPKVATSPIDIKEHWAEKHINRLINTGAISGYPDGSFKPDNNITRAEFATILVKALDLEEKTGKDFKDTKNHWARKYISTAQAHGIISGYDENTFGAEDLITREQMAVMIVKAKKLEKSNNTETFIDGSSISSWAKTAVELASGNDIMKGYPEGDFKPQNKATRAEAVTVIVKIL